MCSAVSLLQTARLHSCQMDRNERVRVTNLCCFSSKVSNCIDQEPRPTFFVLLDLKAVLSEDVWPRKQPPPRARTADSIRLRCALPKLQLAFLILSINAEEQISSFGNTSFIYLLLQQEPSLPGSHDAVGDRLFNSFIVRDWAVFERHRK